MIKNGKPYTCEEGHDDYELLSDGEKPEHMPKEVFEERVLSWIDEFVSPSKKTFARGNSYSLKHRLANWYKSTGLYLTNNQFKDAMMIKGYLPVDPDELNWRYRIKVADVFVEDERLQKLLLPEQNEALKNFVLQKFPGAEVTMKSRKTGSHRYSGVDMGWYICHSRNQVVIFVWPTGDDLGEGVGYLAQYGPPEESVTIRLALIKGDR